MLSARGSSSEEESLARRDEDAIWVEVGLLADCSEESTDKRIEELSELDEDELFDGTRMAELLGFSELECSEDIEEDEYDQES